MSGPGWFTSVVQRSAQAARAIVTHAAVGVVGGSAFGLLYGSLTALIHADWWRVVWTGWYFASCGLAAGLMLGLTRGVFDPQEQTEWPATPARRFRDGPDVLGAGPAVARPGRVRRVVRFRRRLREGVRGGRS